MVPTCVRDVNCGVREHERVLGIVLGSWNILPVVGEREREDIWSRDALPVD